MYRKRLRMGIGIVILIGGLLTEAVYSEDLKVGAVDIQKAVNGCHAGKEAKQALTKEVEKFQRLIEEKQKELQEMRQLLEKQGLMLNPETRAGKREGISDQTSRLSEVGGRQPERGQSEKDGNGEEHLHRPPKGDSKSGDR